MVVTDLTFQRPDHMSARYLALKGQQAMVKEAEEDEEARSQEYAAFLK